ncbi:MAG: RmlD substrate binding domain, partial [Verrucomicrobiota bacterium]
MRIIVTGANGFAGREVVIAALRRGHDVLAVGGSKAVVVPDLLRSITMDLCDIAAVQTLMLEEFPQAVINC